MRSIYDIQKSWRDNLLDGPEFSGTIPERPDTGERFDFLGHPVRSRLGVPAGPLLDSRWIELAAKLGFDALTYKTIRHRPRDAHPLPNILFVDLDDVATTREAPTSLEQLAITNSFGNPSQDRETLLADIDRSLKILDEGQLLIVSVYGDTPEEFLQAAALAKDAGAPVIEANFSCPNIGTAGGSLYESAETVLELGSLLVKAVAPIPLIIKVGFLEQPKEMLTAATRAGIRAISGINTIPARVVTPTGEPALGPARPTGGICGAPIRTYGERFVQKAAEAIRQEQLDLQLIGVGGITQPEHIEHYLELGADHVQTATGMMWDPLLGSKYHARLHPQTV
jgi:dihydroorotate dehydrogenase